MNEHSGLAYWVPGEELPAWREARELAEVLNPPESPRERRQRVAEERAAASRAAGGHEGEGRSFIDRVLGRPGGSTVEAVLARHADDHDRSGDGAADLARARMVLEREGLGHVLPGRIQGVFSADLGVMDSPRHQRVADAPRDVELDRLKADLAGDRAWVQRFADRHAGASIVRSRHGTAVRSESCVHCIDQGVDDETSFLLHNDPDHPVPVTPPGQEGRAAAEGAQRGREVERLTGLGYSRATAELAATPVIRR